MSHAGASGEDAGEDRTECAAHAVDAKRIQRIVVTERILDLAAGKGANDAGDRAHRQCRHRVDEAGSRA